MNVNLGTTPEMQGMSISLGIDADYPHQHLIARPSNDLSLSEWITTLPPLIVHSGSSINQHKLVLPAKYSNEVSSLQEILQKHMQQVDSQKKRSETVDNQLSALNNLHLK